MRRGVGYAVAALALLLPRTLPAEPNPGGPTGAIKMAVVDMQRAVLETEDGLRVQSSLRKHFDRRQSELNGRQEELGRRKDDIERQSKVVSKEALQRSMDDWQRQMADLQTVYMDYERELQKRRSDVMAPIFSRVTGLLRKVAKREGFDLILERQAVPYARTDLDLTDRIILLYNAGEEPDPEPPPAHPATTPLTPPTPAGRGKATP